MRAALTSRAFNRRMVGAGLLRRPARGGGASLPPPMYGLTNFAVSQVARTPNPGGVAGSTGFHVTWVGKLSSEVTAGMMAARGVGFGGGWLLQKLTTNIQLRVVLASGTLTSSPTYTVVASDVDKLMTVCGTYDGTTIRLYIDGVEIGSGTATTGGYTPYVSFMYIGSWENNSIPLTTGTIAGMGGGDTVPTLANIAAWHAATKAARAIVDMPGAGGDHLWPVVNVSPVADTIGADPVSLVGGVTMVAFQPNWRS